MTKHNTKQIKLDDSQLTPPIRKILSIYLQENISKLSDISNTDDVNTIEELKGRKIAIKILQKMLLEVKEKENEIDFMDGEESLEL